MVQLYNLIVLVLSYLIGSINTSIITSKIMTGKDIRESGSGNAGATNALRTLGKRGAAIVVLGDAFKAVAAILLAKLILHQSPDAVYIAGLGAVLGHNFPLYFGFRGGKGIIVSLVAILFADPLIGLVVMVLSLAIMGITKYVSLGSISGAVLFAVLSAIFHRGDTQFTVFAAMLALLAVYMHKSNILRLVRGEENKLSFKKK